MGIFRRPKQAEMPKLEMPSAPDPDKIREEEKTRLRRAQADRTKTTFTTPTGLTSDEPAGQKTLLGS